jgi:carbon-monoxide dehydrogenase medium subunit
VAFEVHQPDNVEQAIRLAGELGPDARYLAGGTDLIIQINRKRRAPRHLIALGGIDGLSSIEPCGEDIRLGAMTTHKTLEQSALFEGGLVALAEAACVVGGHQIRNVATVGGNVVNASPAADLLPPLLVLDASATLAGSGRTRHVAIAEFVRGPGVTERADDELLVSLRFALPPRGSTSSFVKAGRRRAMEISIVCVAALLALDDNGRCATVRIALGAVGPTAMRASEAEHALLGCEPTEAALREAGRAAAARCAPISDVRASAGYRRMLVQALVPRALSRCLQRIEARAS